ncbi:MAG: HupE/UreJ family protein [Proteobacteria bacterium]|nr:HupE/UreJ family protein [Pseudomonadota bacterium]
MRLPLSAALLLSLLALATPAMAHPLGGAGTGWAAGFVHPLGGLDHALAMIAVGLWAAQLGGRALWLVPSTFVIVMLAGGALGASGLVWPALEFGIVGSVLLLGLMVAAALRLPTGLGMAVVGLFALCHGYAHGSEMPAGAGALYVVGFAAATALLHGVGLGLGVAGRAGRALRWGGAGIAAAGLALILGA